MFSASSSLRASKRVALGRFWILLALVLLIDLQKIRSASALSLRPRNLPNILKKAPGDGARRRSASSLVRKAVTTSSRNASASATEEKTTSKSSAPSMDPITKKEGGGAPLVPRNSSSRILPWALGYMYLTNVFLQTLLPVVILPVVASQACAAASGSTVVAGGMTPSSYLSRVASVATLGGAAGRLVNGFVCQGLGGKTSCVLYLTATGLCAIFFGTLGSGSVGLTTARAVSCAAEFCSSIQWTAALYLLTNHFAISTTTTSTSTNTKKGGGDDAAPPPSPQDQGFTEGLFKVTLASTVGILASKAIGPVLLAYLPWTRVAQLGGLVALSGAAVTAVFATEYPDDHDEHAASAAAAVATCAHGASKEFAAATSPLQSLVDAVQAVCGTRLFWLGAVAHGLTYLARQSDRILGAFYQYVTPQLATSLPGLSGGLTASITLGFVHGVVVTGRAWKTRATTARAKRSLFAQKYATAVGSALVLAGLAVLDSGAIGIGGMGNVLATLPPSVASALPWIKAGVVALASGLMASSLSFQFYQMPPTIAQLYGKNRAVVTSWFNAMGFFIAAPVWATAATWLQDFPRWGWPAVWGQLALLFGVAGILMGQALPSVFQDDDDDDGKD